MGKDVVIIRGDGPFESLAGLIVGAVAQRGSANVIPPLRLPRAACAARAERIGTRALPATIRTDKPNKNVRYRNARSLQNLRKIAERPAVSRKS